jgi:hypothetical protein
VLLVLSKISVFFLLQSRKYTIYFQGEMDHDSDELRLYTDDELSEDDESFASNLQPVYGRHTNGSFNRKIYKNDLEKSFLLVLRVSNGIVSIHELLDVLVLEYRLNFITTVVKKIRHNPLNQMIYVIASYADEVFRFINEIRCMEGTQFMVGNSCIKVKLLNDMACQNVRIDNALSDESKSVRNIHFNCIPNNTLSPSFNVMNIWSKIASNDFLLGSVLGVSMKLNATHRVLLHFGSFILNERVDDDLVVSTLREIGIISNQASFSTFILNETQINRLRGSSGGPLTMNEFIANNNILTNPSTIDDIESTVPVAQAHPNLADMVSPIVQEVLRNLGINNHRGARRRFDSQRGRGMRYRGRIFRNRR